MLLRAVGRNVYWSLVTALLRRLFPSEGCTSVSARRGRSKLFRCRDITAANRGAGFREQAKEAFQSLKMCRAKGGWLHRHAVAKCSAPGWFAVERLGVEIHSSNGPVELLSCVCAGIFGPLSPVLCSKVQVDSVRVNSMKLPQMEETLPQ